MAAPVPIWYRLPSGRCCDRGNAAFAVYVCSLIALIELPGEGGDAAQDPLPIR